MTITKYGSSQYNYRDWHREAVCVATAAAARAFRLSALLRSPPGSAYSYALKSLSQSMKSSFSMCMRSTGGRSACHSCRFLYMVLFGREAARQAGTGCVLFASVSVVMNGHVFAEKGSCGAVQRGDKDGSYLADSQTVKNCAIQKHRCFAFYTRSLWGSQKLHFIFTWQLHVKLRPHPLINVSYLASGPGRFLQGGKNSLVQSV